MDAIGAASSRAANSTTVSNSGSGPVSSRPVCINAAGRSDTYPLSRCSSGTPAPLCTSAIRRPFITWPTPVRGRQRGPPCPPRSFLVQMQKNESPSGAVRAPWRKAENPGRQFWNSNSVSCATGGDGLHESAPWSTDWSGKKSVPSTTEGTSFKPKNGDLEPVEVLPIGARLSGIRTACRVHTECPARTFVVRYIHPSAIHSGRSHRRVRHASGASARAPFRAGPLDA